MGNVHFYFPLFDHFYIFILAFTPSPECWYPALRNGGFIAAEYSGNSIKNEIADIKHSYSTSTTNKLLSLNLLISKHYLAFFKSGRTKQCMLSVGIDVSKEKSTVCGMR
ncbi:MAG: hypothetical protein UDF26_01540, partial [Clostridia bacterium]|nr:hypothetical protein [Clostridia bacterium]